MSDKLHQFLPIWAIPDFLKCPVAGAMLTVEKHRSILKKCSYDVKSMKPYEYHQKIMLKLGGKNNVSQKMNNFIRNQSAGKMARIAGMTEQEIRDLWSKHLVTGDVGPLFYAIVSHKKTSPELLADIAGELHMQAHANMTEIFTIRRQLDIMTERLDREKQKLAEKTGGEFHYHDGRMKNASDNMEAKVKRCDLVLCPVNCNSHNACRKVKQLCSRHNKPLKILSSSSLSAVSQALLEPDSTVTLN